MMDCTDVERLIAREADDPSSLGTGERAALEAHLSGCAACRDAAADQRLVAQTLRAREPLPAPAGFAARVSARLDEEDRGLLDLVNWRAWTAGLAPVAAALMLVAYAGLGGATSGDALPDTTATFETWTIRSAGDTPAAVFLQPDSTGDDLLETVLTGGVPAASGAGDGR